MKKNLLTLLTIFSIGFCKAQVVCVLCFDQNDSISSNVTNYIQNGGFESNNCGANGYFCPNSASYSCDFNNWTCTGGGTSTYAHNNMQNALSIVVEGNQCAYMGNFYCNACSNITDDTSCVSDTACTVNSLPLGFPTNTIDFGGTNGVSLEQTVTGLTPGATYCLEFWAGGEGNIWPNRGIFGVDVGFGDTLLRCKETSAGTAMVGTRYIVEFMATSTSHTIKFTNWGHICADCTELMLDDVRLYPLSDLSSNVTPCLGINPVALFSAPNHICPGTCTNFNNLSLNCFSFEWLFPGGTPSVSTDVNPTNICYNTPGTYPVTLIGTNTTTSDTLTLNNYLTVYPYPPAQGITQTGDTLFANPGAVSYQWYLNTAIVNGATNYYYVAQVGGDYSVVATDQNGCEVEAVIFDVLAGIETLNGNNSISVFPDPVNDELEIRIPASLRKNMGEVAEVDIYNIVGEKVLSVHNLNLSQGDNHVIDCSKFSSGSYYVRVNSGDKSYRAEFVKSGNR